MRERSYHRAAGVAWVDAAEVGVDATAVYLALVPDGAPLVLEDSAWAIWSALGPDGGTAGEVTARTAALAGADPAELRSQVAEFLDELVARRVVVTEESPDGVAG